MPLYTSDALILRTYKLGESDRIVVYLTRDRGKKRGVAQALVAAYWTEASTVVIYAVMAVILLVRPQGLFGIR